MDAFALLVQCLAQQGPCSMQATMTVHFATNIYVLINMEIYFNFSSEKNLQTKQLQSLIS